jgi:hypothetical protein
MARSDAKAWLEQIRDDEDMDASDIYDLSVAVRVLWAKRRVEEAETLLQEIRDGDDSYILTELFDEPEKEKDE